MSLVTATDLRKTFRRGTEDVHALGGVSIDLEPGEVVAVIGPSGSGKSTLLNILCGWERADAGTVAWKGIVTTDLHERRWNDIGIIPQRLGLLEDLSARENIELPFVLARGSRERPEADAWMEHLDIARLSDRLPAETSLGEQQRICIARALVMSPRLILADEPTGNQDHRREGLVLDAFRRLAAEGTACLIATHNPQTLSSCDRVVRMHDGVVVADERTERRSPWARTERPTV